MEAIRIIVNEHRALAAVLHGMLYLAHEIRDGYTKAVDKWLAEIHSGCLARDIDHVCLVTDQPLEDALFDYFMKRVQLY